MILKRLLTLLAAVATLLLSHRAQAADGKLYGISDQSRIYLIDDNAGMATPIGTVPTHVVSLAGASFLDGELYVTDLFDVDFNPSMAIVDTTTGAFTPISDQGGSLNWQGLASDEAHDLLYTVDTNDGAKLKSITPAGLITTIGPGVGYNVNGLAYDNSHGILYAIGSGVFMTIDTTTGIGTQIGDFGVHFGSYGLAYNEITQTLYANEASFRLLYKIDVMTGVPTLVGPNLVDDDITGLAWLAPIPEPSAWILGVIGLTGFWRCRYRTRR